MIRLGVCPGWPESAGHPGYFAVFVMLWLICSLICNYFLLNVHLFHSTTPPPFALVYRAPSSTEVKTYGKKERKRGIEDSVSERDWGPYMNQNAAIDCCCQSVLKHNVFMFVWLYSVLMLQYLCFIVCGNLLYSRINQNKFNMVIIFYNTVVIQNFWTDRSG